MIVEDELVSRKKLVTLFEEYGHCYDFERGDIAIQAFEESIKIKDPFDLVIIDMFMPHVGGTSVLRKIRDMEQDANIQEDRRSKIIMISATIDDTTLTDLYQQGCNYFLKKTIAPENVTWGLMQIGILRNPLKHLRIMVVDDELISRKKLIELLKPYGTPVEFPEANPAIAYYMEEINQGRPVHLVTLDVSMPEVDGFELLRELRRFEATKNIERGKGAKIVMVTSTKEREKVLGAIEQGCDDYITKPFDEGRVFKSLYKLFC